MNYWPKDNFSRHVRHLITCDEFGNKPILRGVKNHMRLAPSMMKLVKAVKDNETLLSLPTIERCYKEFETELEKIYGTNTEKS